MGLQDTLKLGLFISVFAMICPQRADAGGDGNIESTIDPAVVAIDESKYLGTQLDKEYVLIDERGDEFTLGDVLGQPLILLFSYYTCDGLCWTINKHLAVLLKKIDRFVPGKDFRVLTVSFDQHDGLEQLRNFVTKVGVSDELQMGWKLAVLKNSIDIEKFTGNVGIRYFWSYRDRMFIHPNVFIFISPTGRVVRYLYGTSIGPKDMELALIDADWNKISNSGQIINILAGVCYSYNFKEGRYTVNYPLFIGTASLLCGIGLIVVSFGLAKRKFRS